MLNAVIYACARGAEWRPALAWLRQMAEQERRSWSRCTAVRHSATFTFRLPTGTAARCDQPPGLASTLTCRPPGSSLPCVNRGFNSCIFAFEDVLSEDDATGQQANTRTTY